MNLRDLRYLVALAEHRHFGKAAAASFVSQPTLSTQIRKLEEELGTALIERSSRHVMLTPLGREIAERARLVLAQVDEMKQLARQAADPESGSLRLGLFPTLAPYLLPLVIPAINRRFPQLQLLLIEEKTRTLLTQLHEGRLDAAVLALPLHEDRLHVEFLFEEPFMLAVPDTHPLAAQPCVRLDDLNRESLLLLEDGHCLRDQALDVCQLAGAMEKPGFRATSLETLRQMVATGVGITLLPQLAVTPPAPVSTGIRLIRFAEPAPHRRIAMVWRKSSPLDALLQTLSPLLRNLPAKLLEPDPPAPRARKTARARTS